MALEVNIGGDDDDLFVDEDKTLRLEVLDDSSLPVDIAGWSILFDVRVSDREDDPALISLTATISGLFNAVRASNLQRAVFSLSATNMSAVTGRKYRHSFKRTDSGFKTVLAFGNFTPRKATAP